MNIHEQTLPMPDVGHEILCEAIRRAKGEFLEMPGLKLTTDQARRLWALDARLCEAVLAALVESRFLVQTRNAAFTRNA